MRKLLLTLTLGLITAGVSSLNVHGQDTFPYDQFMPRTVGELVQAGAASIAADKEPTSVHMMLDAKPFLSAIRLKYVGTFRPLPAERRQVLEMYQKSMPTTVDISSLVENEYLFKECDTEYWIPVEKQVAAYFPKELKTGDMITVYLIVIGGIKLTAKDPYQPVFLVEEFKKYE